jgi:hypothetical protein
MSKLIASIVLLAMTGTLLAEPRQQRRTRRHNEPNWIIERQRAYQVQGVPTSRLIIGKRQIDIYPSGVMFEKGNVVGVGR